MKKFLKNRFLMKCLSYLLKINFFSPNKSRFKTDNSCIKQHLAITHEISKAFDKDFEVRRIFVDILTVLGKVCHKGSILKLKQNGISDNSLNLCDFLRNRKPRVLFNGQVPDWSDVEAGVPQSSS